MGRTRNSDYPLDARERTALIHGEGAREWRVHLAVGQGPNARVRETVFVTAPDPDSAQAAAEAFSRVERAGGGLPVRDGLRRLAEPTLADTALVEPVYYCAEGCGAQIITPDPRTARYPDGSPVPPPDPGDIRCVRCGAIAHYERAGDHESAARLRRNRESA